MHQNFSRILILSNNFIFSSGLARLLQHKTLGCRKSKAITLNEFFREKVTIEDNAILFVHSESFQLSEEIEMLKQFSYSVFSKIILSDSCISLAEKKFDFLPTDSVVQLSLNENGITLVRNILNILKETSGTRLAKEEINPFAALRTLVYSQKFNDKHLELLNLLPSNFDNINMASKLNVSLRQYNRLQEQVAAIAGVVNTKQALLKYAIDKGILLAEEDDEELPYISF